MCVFFRLDQATNCRLTKPTVAMTTWRVLLIFPLFCKITWKSYVSFYLSLLLIYMSFTSCLMWHLNAHIFFRYQDLFIFYSYTKKICFLLFFSWKLQELMQYAPYIKCIQYYVFKDVLTAEMSTNPF